MPEPRAGRAPASQAAHRARSCRTAWRPPHPAGRSLYTYRAAAPICAHGRVSDARCTSSGCSDVRRDALFFDHALLPAGWARDVRIAVADGTIAAVERGAARDGADHVAGIAVPGLPNLHCHAFQRGMAGLAERRGPAADSFWTWREVMYRFLERLTPDDVEAIAAFAYMEMLEAGFTTVGEFHYLHHDIDGRPYADHRRDGGAHRRRQRRKPASASPCCRRSTPTAGSAARRRPPASAASSTIPTGFSARRAHPRHRGRPAGRARRHRPAFAARGDARDLARRLPGDARRARSTSMPPSR